MKLQHLVVSIGLALSGSLASADVAQFAFEGKPQTGAFSEVFHFTVVQGADFFGSLTTSSTVSGDLGITSLTISNGSTQYRYDTLNDGFDFASIAAGTTTTVVKGYPVTHFTNTYAWDSEFLSAGVWTLTVTGNNASDKSGATFNVSLIDPPAAVPEPASLALVGIALGGLAVARRRTPRQVREFARG